MKVKIFTVCIDLDNEYDRLEKEINEFINSKTICFVKQTETLDKTYSTWRFITISIWYNE